MGRSRDDDDDDDDRPRKKKRRDDDEDDEDDDAPVKKKKSRRRDDDDEDDDEDDRPAKKKRKVGQKGAGGVGLMIGLGIGALVLLGGIVALVWLLVSGGGMMAESPQKGYEEFQNAAATKNYGVFYDRLDTETQNLIETTMLMQAQMLAAFAPNSPLAGKKGRELFVTYCKEADKSQGRNENTVDTWSKKKGTVQTVKMTGETTADVTVRGADGSVLTLGMVKQNGTWRIRLLGGFNGGGANPNGGFNPGGGFPGGIRR